jgi:hypothetical protein
MHFKNKSGFTLIEAMLAVVMIGMVLTPLFLLEGTVFQGVSRFAQIFRRYMFAKEYLYEMRRNQTDDTTSLTLEKNSKDARPATALRYTLGPVGTKSSLKDFKRLYKETVVASGMDKSAVSATLITFVYKPEPVAS